MGFVGRLYVKYLRSLAEKTDLGRLTSPSIMRFVDESMNISGNKSPFDGQTSAAMWDTLERFLEVSIYLFHNSAPSTNLSLRLLVDVFIDWSFNVERSRQIQKLSCNGSKQSHVC